MEQDDKGMEQTRNSPWDQRRRHRGSHSSWARNKIIKVVFDTNIIIYASFWNGNPYWATQLVLENKIKCFSSQELINEYKHAVFRDFQISEVQLNIRIKDLLSAITLVNPQEKVFTVIDDPDDNKVLETALEAKADYVVSGDKHLLKLKEFRGIKILTAKEFLDIILPANFPI